MRFLMIGVCAMSLWMGGCESTPATTQPSAGNLEFSPDTPAGVKAAFAAKHPYDVPQSPVGQIQNGTTVYTISFTRPDGTTGKAVYTDLGVVVQDD